MARVNTKQSIQNAPLPVVTGALAGNNVTPITDAKKRGRPAKSAAPVQTKLPEMVHGQTYMLPHTVLTPNPENPRGFNPAISTGDNEFLAMIEAGGGVITTDIEVIRQGEHLIVERGNRRLASLRSMAARGLDVPLVPVRLFRPASEMERAYDRQISNTGKPLSMLELGNLCQTLHAKYGQSDDTIGAKFGKSGRYIELCRALANTAPPIVKGWIAAETIAASLVSDLMRGQVIQGVKGWDASVALVDKAIKHQISVQTGKQAAGGKQIRVTKETLLAVSAAPAKERAKREVKKAEPTPEQIAANERKAALVALRDASGLTSKEAQIAKTKLDIVASQEATLAKAVEAAPDAKARKASLAALKAKAAERKAAEQAAAKAEAAKVAAKAAADAAKAELETAAAAAKASAEAAKAKAGADSQRDTAGPAGVSNPDNSKPLLPLYVAKGASVQSKSGTEIARATSKEIAGMIAHALNYTHTHSGSDQ